MYFMKISVSPSSGIAKIWVPAHVKFACALVANKMNAKAKVKD